MTRLEQLESWAETIERSLAAVAIPITDLNGREATFPPLSKLRHADDLLALFGKEMVHRQCDELYDQHVALHNIALEFAKRIEGAGIYATINDLAFWRKWAHINQLVNPADMQEIRRIARRQARSLYEQA